MSALAADAEAVRAAAPAKINLYLHVTGKRPDGYHTLDSLVVFAAIQDVVDARPADTLSLSVEGPFAHAVPVGPDNLVLRAAQALAVAAGQETGAHLTLTKRLPAASGIGGGSADAAAALRALRRLWNVDLDDAALDRIALGLGADVPVCLHGKAAFMGGIGEHLAPPPALPQCWLVLANPGISVSTPDVFRARTGAYSPEGRFAYAPANAAELAALLGARRNDLEAPATSLVPAIADVKAALMGEDGCVLARLSGSGATVFGLFSTAEAASHAALALAAGHPDWWVRPASLETNALRLDRDL